MAIANATELLAENPATVVEGLLAIPNVHDSNMVDLVTIERGTFGPRKYCWATVNIEFFGPCGGRWQKALDDGQALRLNLVEG